MSASYKVFRLTQPQVSERGSQAEYARKYAQTIYSNVSKVSIKVKISKETRPTTHVTCGPTGPTPEDVIGGMLPFSSAKEQYAGF